MLSRKEKRPPYLVKGERGAVLVEFACTLMYVFFFFVVFIQITGIFLAHEQLSFGAFAASQKYAVGNSSDAQAAAYKIAGAYPFRVFENGDATETLKGITLSFRKELSGLPIDLNNIFAPPGSGRFTISKHINVFVEPDPAHDDN